MNAPRHLHIVRAPSEDELRRLLDRIDHAEAVRGDAMPVERIKRELLAAGYEPPLRKLVEGGRFERIVERLAWVAIIGLAAVSSYLVVSM